MNRLAFRPEGVARRLLALRPEGVPLRLIRWILCQNLCQYEGSLVQKFDHEVPVEFVDQYFQLMFMDEMVQTFVINTDKFVRNTNIERWFDTNTCH